MRDFAEIAGREWDVLVVGAGPAGSLAARQLALDGASVLLVEKAAFPRWKVCGCCLNGLALSTLESVGLGTLPERLHAQPLRRFRLATPSGQVSFPLPIGMSVSREAFDTALVSEAAQAGAVFMLRTSARVGPEVNSTREVTLSYRGVEAVVRARVVLVADGLSGQALKDLPGFELSIRHSSRVGAAAVLESDAAAYESGTIYMACGHGGYVGLVRLEDGRIDVAAALDRAELRAHGGPAELVTRLLADTALPRLEELHTTAWRGTPALTQRRTPISERRLFVLGDAAGYVEPFTGEGMAWAMLSATLVVPLARAAIDDWTAELSRQWERRYRRVLQPRQRVVRAASYVLRHPRLTGILVHVLDRVPQVATPVIDAMNAPARQASLR